MSNATIVKKSIFLTMVEHTNKNANYFALYLYHYFSQLAVMIQGVFCFHTQTHTYYQFTEEGADKGSDEVGSVLYDWICNAKLREKRPFKKLHIWVDNCSGQNKNHYLVCMLLFVVQIGLLDKIIMEFLVSNFSQLLLINKNTLHNKFGELLLIKTD